MADVEPSVVSTKPETRVPHRTGSSISSLKFKATALIVALTLAVTAAVSSYLMRSTLELARQDREQRLTMVSAMLARAAAEPLSRGDMAGLAAIASDLADGHPLLYAVFTNAHGQELLTASSNDGLIPDAIKTLHAADSVPGQPIRHKLWAGGVRCLDGRYPIALKVDPNGEKDSQAAALLGYVQVGMRADGWHQWMASKVDMLAGIGLLAAGVAIPLGFLVVRRIISPLEGLAAAMHRFSMGGLDVRSPVQRLDEIGQLAAAFNCMADQHQQTHQRIVKLNEELEKRVAQRTRQLRELAERDPLTGLYNRRQFKNILERSFSEATRYGNDLACIMIDLDDFKRINDLFGHQIGDEVLTLTATTIESELRTSDYAARYGGDEFVVLLPQTDQVRAEVLAERIASRFQRVLTGTLPQVQTGLSGGIASVVTVQALDAESLVRAADHALYEAKAAGKNCIVTAGTGVRRSAV